MQSNTTGLSMEVFYIILLKLSLLMNLLLFRQMRKVISFQKSSQDLHKETHAYLDDLSNHVESLDKKVSKTDSSPMKPNNWDSVREAFKGPTRNEVNERT